jgi:hypothetical protein
MAEVVFVQFTTPVFYGPATVRELRGAYTPGLRVDFARRVVVIPAIVKVDGVDEQHEALVPLENVSSVWLREPAPAPAPQKDQARGK